MEGKGRVCVTGAGGYLGSWVVKDLLHKGYTVHGTVRDPCDEKKNGHLKKLENSSENLHIFKADLLDYQGLYNAVKGCTGVFHVACPVPGTRKVLDPEAEMLQPAIEGTVNILKACTNANVKKVVIVSSLATVMDNPNWPKDQPIDESCWSDVEFCRMFKNWYGVGKTIAENKAWDYAKNTGLNLVTVCPSVVIGPMLQSTLNASTSFLLEFMKDTKATVENRNLPYVYVQDTVDAIILAYEKPEAEGRYICSAFTISSKELVEKLKSMYPDYQYPTSFIEVEQLNSGKLNCKKLENLGLKFTPVDETLVNAVKNLEETGLLAVVHKHPDLAN
ncbi:Cinnamoyl-CoA reductase [Heracleum sosnowskyi]|uniref:Cinnamoyl-CoA reductase n=1 Tax=Heracleum sosnowskyi TaxID=360622 RepID=A0AAD8IRF8_9APIA|nr:Cinnamoyl-CoA reductase [Heracleum sosnowskyi]